MNKKEMKNKAISLESIPKYAEIIVPSNNNDLPNVCRRIHIGTAGNLTVDLLGLGTNITFTNLAAGSEKTGLFTKVYLTGTTAGGLVAEW